jgi:hypothetical protein
MVSRSLRHVLTVRATSSINARISMSKSATSANTAMMIRVMWSVSTAAFPFSGDGQAGRYGAALSSTTLEVVVAEICRRQHL